jgi:hypothetical protein
VSEPERRYISYLLRLWQIERQGQLVWQASLEDSRTGERQGFGNVDALLAFLRQMTDVATNGCEKRGLTEDSKESRHVQAF